MQVDVKNFLACSSAIRKIEIDPLAADGAAAKCASHTLADSKNVGAGVGVQFGKRGSVFVRNHKEVTWIHRPNIEKGGALLVLIDPAGRKLVCHNFAEDAVVHRFDSFQVQSTFDTASGKR